MSGTLGKELEQVGYRKQSSGHRGSGPRSRNRFPIFVAQGDRWFHAASTIKVAVLLALFRAADEGRLRLNDSLHVRNRFFSAAGGTVFHVSRRSGRDARAVSIHWTNSEDLRARARNDFREQQSGDESAAGLSWVWNMRGRSCEKRKFMALNCGEA